MPKSVLIIDDEASIILSLRHLMQREGYHVRVASDGEAALAEVTASPPDLILLDVMIPKRDGYDICQTIRANPDWNKLKIIMVGPRSARRRQASQCSDIRYGKVILGTNEPPMLSPTKFVW